MLRAFSMRSNQLGSRVVSDAGRKLMMMPAPAHQLAPSRHPLCTNASAENAAAPQDTTERMRQPYVPLYKGQQLSEAISAAEGHIAGPGVFQLTVRGEPQAASAMRLLQSLAISQKQAGKQMEVRWISLRKPDTEQQQQQQQQQKGYFNFRHLLVCRVTEPRLPVPEKEIRVSSQSKHREIALRAYDVLKEEAIKPAALPTVALTSVGAASHVQAFKAIHTLRVMLRNIRRGLVVQLDEHKVPSRNEDGSELPGLRYNIFLEELPQVNRPSENGNQ
mmetsp:Transcript_27722/g.75002  ORF Transcript_27722/g.75002 Transcript_27722/m.75002 type:complete len:276 (-) Transcript_27722:333-1160(-)